MAREIDKAGIPTVLITPMPSVALNVGANRIEVGTAITHPLGDPGLNDEEEFELRRRLATDALGLLAERIDEQVVRRLAS